MFSSCLHVLMVGMLYSLRCISAENADSSSLKLSRLHSDLLLQSNYKVSLKPKPQTTIRISFDLFSINDFDEIKGNLNAVGVVHLNWDDHRLEWNMTKRNVEYISFHLNEVWRPEISLLNTVHKFIITDRELDKTTVWVTSYGRVYFAIGSVFSVSCDPDVTFYPFDVHECYLFFVPFEDVFFTEHIMNGTLQLADAYFNPSDIIDMDGKWYFYSLKPCIRKVGNSNIHAATFPVRLERRWKFVFLNTIIPVLLLGYLNICVYLIPVEAGERISFAITVLLSYTVFMIVMAGSIPETSSPMPLISYFLIIKLGYSSCIAISVIIVTRLYHRQDNEHIPKINCKLTSVIERISNSICRTRFSADSDIASGGQSQETPDTNSSVSDNCRPNIHNDSKEHTSMTWQRVSIALDKVFMIFFACVITTELILFFVVLSKSFDKTLHSSSAGICSEM